MMTDRWAKGDNLKAPCPLCSGVLVVRENTKEGVLFVGCRSFPSCRMNRPLRDDDERNTADSFPATEEAEERADSYTGTMCSVCHQPQFMCPHGVTCTNGHGGADGIDPGTYRPQDCPDDSDPMFEAMHKMSGGSTLDPSLLVAAQKMPDRHCRLVTSPELSDLFEEDSGYRLHVKVSLEPIDTDLEVRRVDMDIAGIPFDLDQARARRDAGHNVALEMTGRLLPRIVETMGRVIW